MKRYPLFYLRLLKLKTELAKVVFLGSSATL
jgi:hypothetical protein